MSVREMDWSDQEIPNVDLTTELSPSKHEPADHSMNHAASAWLRAECNNESAREFAEVNKESARAAPSGPRKQVM